MKRTEYIFGIHPVLEAMDSGQEVDKILFQKNLRGEQTQQLLKKARELDIPVQHIPLEGMNKVTRKNHQGIIAYLSPITYQNLDEIVMRSFEEGRDPFVLVLDGVTDVRNMGAIARTAECAGVDIIVVPIKGGARIGGDAIKTSAGALMTIPVHRTANLAKTVEQLKNYGLQIVSCTEKTDNEYTTGEYKGPIAVVMGSEEMGISNQILKITDFSAKLPLMGKIESLNVSVAAGVMMYEILRQRKNA